MASIDRREWKETVFNSFKRQLNSKKIDHTKEKYTVITRFGENVRDCLSPRVKDYASNWGIEQGYKLVYTYASILTFCFEFEKIE